MKNQNTSWVKYAVFLTLLTLILGALVFWLCSYLVSQNGKVPSDPTPPAEDGSEIIPDRPLTPDGSTAPNMPDTPDDPDSSEAIDGSEYMDGSEIDTSTKPNMNPDQTRLELEAFLMGQEESRPVHITERMDYLDAEQFQEISVYMSSAEFTALELGKSHAFYAITIDIMTEEPWCNYSLATEETSYYILSDGSILVTYTYPSYTAKRYNTVAELPNPHIYGTPVWIRVSLEKAQNVVQGMTYSEIVDLLGVPGKRRTIHQRNEMRWYCERSSTLDVFFDSDEILNDMSVATEVKLMY